MSVATKIRTRTKTYCYLYKFALKADFGFAVARALRRLETDKLEEFHAVNAYLHDMNYPEGDSQSCVLYITCDTRNPRFKQAIEKIMESNHYINHYLLQDEVTCCIRMKFTEKESWFYFLEGKYSKMFQDFSNESLDSCFKPLKRLDYGLIRPLTAIRKNLVRLKNDLGFDPTEDLKDNEIKDFLNSEFDSKIDLRTEILNYKEND